MPTGFVTVTSTGPIAPAGETAVSELELCTVKLAGTPPKSTSVVPARFAPLTVTVVPPPSGPLAGLTALTVGAGANVKRSAALVALFRP